MRFVPYPPDDGLLASAVLQDAENRTRKQIATRCFHPDYDAEAYPSSPEVSSLQGERFPQMGTSNR